MKRKIFFYTIILLIFTSHSALSESFISLGGGSFEPNDKIHSDFDSGFNATASYTIQANSFLAYGFDFALNQTKAQEIKEENKNKVTLSTFGIESLLYLQPHNKKIQPFAGIGFGIYGNSIIGELNEKEYHDESGSSMGLVAKAGINFYMDKTFFLSFYGKYYSNSQEFEYQDETREDKNLGGINFIFAMGARL